MEKKISYSKDFLLGIMYQFFLTCNSNNDCANCPYYGAGCTLRYNKDGIIIYPCDWFSE